MADELSMMMMDAYPRRNPRLAARRIGDETVIVQAEQSRLHLLTNDVASRIWQLADGRTAVRTICERLSEEYDVPPAELTRDVAQFLGELTRQGIVTLESQPVDGSAP